MSFLDDFILSKKSCDMKHSEVVSYEKLRLLRGLSRYFCAHAVLFEFLVDHVDQF